MSVWLEDALVSMPSEGRFTIKSGDLAFGFTDDRKTEKGNQDRLAIAYCLDPDQATGKWFFAGVCDGVGGEARGELAASIALAQIVAHLCSAKGPLQMRLAAAIRQAHSAVQHRLHRRSATTFVGLLINDQGEVAIGSVGDSRAYSVTDDSALQITKDDTVAEMLRRQSNGSSDHAVMAAIKALQPQWQESLGQAIGSDLPLTPNLCLRPPSTSQDGLLLCTDGVWKSVEPVLQAVVPTSVGRRDLARRLLTLTEHLGANDNSTAIVVPDVNDVISWLRATSRRSEQGLLHLVLPIESGIVPISLFAALPVSTSTPGPAPASPPTPTLPPKPIPEVMQGTPLVTSEYSREKVESNEKLSKNKRRRKSAKTTEKGETRDPRVFQMSIVDGPRDAEPDAPSKVQKDRK